MDKQKGEADVTSFLKQNLFSSIVVFNVFFVCACISLIVYLELIIKQTYHVCFFNGFVECNNSVVVAHFDVEALPSMNLTLNHFDCTKQCCVTEYDVGHRYICVVEVGHHEIKNTNAWAYLVEGVVGGILLSMQTFLCLAEIIHYPYKEDQ